MTDFANSDYQEITPEEAYKLFKAEQSRNVHVVIGGKLANVYIATDPTTGKKKTTYDFKCRGNFVKDNGKQVENSAWLTPRELYERADKIYLVNETPMDQALLAKRAENPESGKKFAKGAFKRIKPSLAGKGSSDYQVKQRINNGQIKVDPKAGTARLILDPNYMALAKDNNGNPMNPNNWYTAEEFERLRDAFLRKWTRPDPDIGSVDYVLDQLTNQSGKGLGPADYDWKYFDTRKNRMASLRYKNLEDTLQGAIIKGKEIANQISSFNRTIERRERDKQRVLDPDRIASKKAQIQYDIQYYQNQVNSYMKRLLKLQDELDDVDLDNQREIDDIDKEISDVMDKINDLRSQMKGLFTK